MPDASFVLPLIVQSALVPFGVAAAMLAAIRALRLSATASAVAVGMGFIAAYFAVLHAQWSLVPKVALDWLPWIVVLGTACAIAGERARRAAARWAARLAVSAAAAWLVVAPGLESFGPSKAVLYALIICVLTSAAWGYMAQLADRRPTPPLLLAVVAGGAGLALMLDSSQSIGQLSGALASVLAACIAFMLPRAHTPFAPASAGVAVLILASLLATAHLYAGFSLGYVALLVGGLSADALLGAINRLRRRDDGIAASWATAAVIGALPVVVTIGLAVKAAHDMGGY